MDVPARVLWYVRVQVCDFDSCQWLAHHAVGRPENSTAEESVVEAVYARLLHPVDDANTGAALQWAPCLTVSESTARPSAGTPEDTAEPTASPELPCSNELDLQNDKRYAMLGRSKHSSHDAGALFCVASGPVLC